MGKVEKVIVLSVLFLIAVILVFSLTMDDPLNKKNVSVLGNPAPKLGSNAMESQKPAADVSGASGKVAGAVPTPAPASTPPSPTGNAIAEPSNTSPPAGNSALPSSAAQQPAAPGALLSSNVAVPPAHDAPPATHVAAAAPQIPAGSILLRLDGLQESYMPDMRFYTWQAGDTFRGIAHAYYGDFTKLTILRRANEGRKDVQPGEKIFVPVYDLDRAAGAPPAVAAATGKSTPIGSVGPTGAGAPGTAKSPAKEVKGAQQKSATGAHSHTVKEGESLWKIAKSELGAGTRWNEIYEANRDVLSSPEALHTGMKLRIP